MGINLVSYVPETDAAVKAHTGQCVIIQPRNSRNDALRMST